MRYSKSPTAYEMSNMAECAEEASGVQLLQ